MLIRDLPDLPEFVAGDGTRLREILNPAKESLALRYSLAHAVLPPGGVSLRHRLSASEVYHITEGEGTMHIDGESRAVRVGATVYIPPGSVQHIENRGAGRLAFICIVDPAWTPECEQVLEGGPGGGR
jgi:mannose-6-phosphate isomerase-like protein (cupin superfamily)